MMEFYTREKYTARKVHKCEMCGGDIKPGEEYSRETGKWEGEFYCRKLHIECCNILGEFCRDSCEEEFTYEWIRDWWRDTKCQNCKRYYPSCEPDGDCFQTANDCCWHTKNGRCTNSDTCYEMTRYCWCDKYEPEECKIGEL